MLTMSADAARTRLHCPDGAVEAWMRRSGGALVQRNGRTVAIHYSSTLAELAVCSRSAGIAIRSDLDVIELTGSDLWLEVMIERASGSPPPAVGSVSQLPTSICARTSPATALVVGADSATSRWRRIIREAAASGSRVSIPHRSTGYGVIEVIGPRVESLLHLAGLPLDRPCSVRTNLLAHDVARVTRTDRQRVLLIVPEASVPVTCEHLFHAGAELRPAMVGADAVAMLGAGLPSRARA